MAGTMPHAIFVETDVDGAGLVGAYAAELPGCAVFAATDDEAAAGDADAGQPLHRLAAGQRRGGARLRRRQLVRGRARCRRRSRWRPSPRRLHPRRAAADRRRVRHLAALARAGPRGAGRRRSTPAIRSAAAELLDAIERQDVAFVRELGGQAPELSAGPGRPPLRGARRADRRPRGRGLRRRRRAAASCGSRSPTTCAPPRRCAAPRDRPRHRRAEARCVTPASGRRPLRGARRRGPSCAHSRTRCRAARTARARCCRGTARERAMLIGQAPGWREIETGLPFAWDAGKRLCGWLAAAGIGVDDFRERWYVTSVGKCYPGRAPGSSVDRPPSRAEIERWTPYLREELRLVAARAGRCWSAGWRIGSRSARRPGSTSSWGGSWPGRRRRAHRSCACRIRRARRPGSTIRRASSCGGAGIGLLRDRWAELGVTREARWWASRVAALGAFVRSCSWSATLGAPRPEVDPLTVEEVLAEGPPAERWASEELYVAGWYAELDARLRRRRRRRGRIGRVAPARLPAARPAPVAAGRRRHTGGAAGATGCGWRRRSGNVFPSRAEPGGSEPARPAARLRRCVRRSGRRRRASRSASSDAGTPSS